MWKRQCALWQTGIGGDMQEQVKVKGHLLSRRQLSCRRPLGHLGGLVALFIRALRPALIEDVAPLKTAHDAGLIDMRVEDERRVEKCFDLLPSRCSGRCDRASGPRQVP